MHVILAMLTARPGCADRYEALLRDVVDTASKAACFVRFNIHRDGDRFLLYEIWTDAEAYGAVRGEPFFQAYLRDRAALVEPDVQRSDWKLLHSVARRA